MTIELIFMPKESANDTEVSVVDVLCESGQRVLKEDILLEVEGSKTVYEVVSPVAGWVYFSQDISVGDTFDVSELIAIVSPTEICEEEVEKIVVEVLTSGDQEIKKLEVRIPAQQLGNGKEKGGRLAIIGGGRGLTQILEIIDSHNHMDGFQPVGIYDDGLYETWSQRYGIPILGKINPSQMLEDFESKVFDHLIISISTDIELRSRLWQELGGKVSFPNLIHSSVNLPKYYRLGQGNVLLPNSHIGQYAEIGNNNFISAMCNIEHHSVLGSHNTFGPGVILSGSVNIGSRIKFGTGIYIEPKIKISDDQFVRSNQLINRDL